ncbi:MAG TPA: hypothetical protein VGH79_01510 [Gaiellaceae bacterium]
MILLIVVCGAAFLVSTAFSSTILSRNVKRPTLTIDKKGVAHVSYYLAGRKKTLAAWGAINARKPSATVPQVKFHIRYGERGSGVCRPYDGPPLVLLVKACKAPDGSYWALQSWARLSTPYGGTTGAKELHLSHWRGPLAELVLYQNWSPPNHVRHLFGRLTYNGVGVYGYSNTHVGNPLDGYGRNIYIDTYDSAYGKGWHRETAFLTHRKSNTPGTFCYGFIPHGSHPSGQGTKYRATVIGPGVTPIVRWQADDIGAFDQATQDQMQALERSWGDPKCRA